jgi:Flp pilus assembly protein TadB
VSEQLDASAYLNTFERRVLGRLSRRLLSVRNPRLERALAENGPKATARMTVVNVLRLYAIGLFVAALFMRLLGVPLLADPFYVLAGASMCWSLWALYTAYTAEREFKREQGPVPAGRRRLGIGGEHPSRRPRAAVERAKRSRLARIGR